MRTAALRADWELMSYPPRTKGVLSAMIEVADYPDQAAAVLAFMTRQSLLRAWGEFQQEHPLIVAPIFTGVPFEAGKAYTTADEARTRNWPSDASAALIATAVWEALCGSTPIITTAMTGISFRDPGGEDRGGHAQFQGLHRRSRPSFEPRHGEAPARWHVV